MNNHLTDNRRHNIITASQAWGAVYERQKLWREKIFSEKPFEGNEMTQWGNDHEEVALRAFERHMNDICENGNKLIVHPDLPIGASADAFLNDIPVEIKCPFSQKIYPTIPERYWFQMQLQMSVVKQKQCYFMIWTPQDFKVQMVDYDQDFIDWYIPYAKQFLECVANDTRPERWSKRPIYNHKEK